MGDVRFLSHARLRREARARLAELRRPRQLPTDGDAVQQPTEDTPGADR